ncbi:uncharacterized protein LOC116307761 [Actinia tenebrosa]|uniref:Uncharacterized protein LOC116307761 n=1 Tax=Actinia tenebrosa TaxID=6105 RepID=A0A6P8J2T6_ACTTE|nr:uncharacterized protein LOC116307761 [Actinia tenebrosa]
MASNQQKGDESIPLEANETPEDCAKRLSRRLSEYEAASIDIEGRANQLRKERDAERALNQKLHKEVEKLSNQLLHERTTNALLAKKVKMLENKDDDEVKTDPDNMDASSIPSDVFSDKDLALKVKELQKIIEERIKEEEKKQPEDEADIHNKMAALVMLHQSTQNYLEEKNDNEDSEDDSVETLNTVETLVEGLKNTHEYLEEKKKKGKPQVSTWMRIFVCLGPIFLSALCYLAFASVKK